MRAHYPLRVAAGGLLAASLLALVGCDGQQKELLGAVNAQLRELAGKVEALSKNGADAQARIQAAEAAAKALEIQLGALAIRTAGAEANAESAMKSFGDFAGKLGTLESRLAAASTAGSRADTSLRNVNELAARLQSLETRAASADTAARSLEAMRRELSAQDARLKAFESRPAAPAGNETERALAARLAAAEARGDAALARVGEAERSLGARIGDAEKAATARFGTLESRLAAVTAAAETAARNAGTALTGRLAEHARSVDERVGRLEARLATMTESAKSADASAAAANAERFRKLEAAFVAAAGRIIRLEQGQQPASERLAGLESRIDSIARAVAAPTAPARRSAAPEAESGAVITGVPPAHSVVARARLEQLETRLAAATKAIEAMAQRAKDDEKREAALAERNAELARELADARRRLEELERRALTR